MRVPDYTHWMSQWCAHSHGEYKEAITSDKCRFIRFIENGGQLMLFYSSTHKSWFFNKFGTNEWYPCDYDETIMEVSVPTEYSGVCYVIEHNMNVKLIHEGEPIDVVLNIDSLLEIWKKQLETSEQIAHTFEVITDEDPFSSSHQKWPALFLVLAVATIFFSMITALAIGINYGLAAHLVIPKQFFYLGVIPCLLLVITVAISGVFLSIWGKYQFFKS